MPRRASRRRVLRLAGATAAVGLAGCSRSDDAAGTITVTPAPIPSARSRTSTGSVRVTSGPSADDLRFDVRLRSGFTQTSPARLDITVHNVGTTTLTALGGPEHVLPFVDDDYAGVDRTGHASLFLAPDDAALTIAPAEGEPGPLRDFLPAAPVDGCWSLPFDWPDAWGQRRVDGETVPIRPGETRRHGYSLYYIDECIAGTFTFANSFELAAGNPPIERPPARARLGFVVTVTADLDVLVGVHDPAISTPAGGTE